MIFIGDKTSELLCWFQLSFVSSLFDFEFKLFSSIVTGIKKYFQQGGVKFELKPTPAGEGHYGAGEGIQGDEGHGYDDLGVVEDHGSEHSAPGGAHKGKHKQPKVVGAIYGEGGHSDLGGVGYNDLGGGGGHKGIHKYTNGGGDGVHLGGIHGGGAHGAGYNIPGGGEVGYDNLKEVGYSDLGGGGVHKGIHKYPNGAGGGVHGPSIHGGGAHGDGYNSPGGGGGGHVDLGGGEVGYSNLGGLGSINLGGTGYSDHGGHGLPDTISSSPVVEEAVVYERPQPVQMYFTGK